MNFRNLISLFFSVIFCKSSFSVTPENGWASLLLAYIATYLLILISRQEQLSLRKFILFFSSGYSILSVLFLLVHIIKKYETNFSDTYFVDAYSNIILSYFCLLYGVGIEFSSKDSLKDYH